MLIGSRIGTNATSLNQIKQEAMNKAERLAAFNRDKFGMFIHWGPYAVLAGQWKGRSRLDWAEWIALHVKASAADYEAVCRSFNPRHYDAEEWVRIAQDAGMKYMVFTTKHHDGFCMFKSKHTGFNIVDYTGFGRDPLQELAEACDKLGMRLGLYYSISDWHYPDFPAQYSNQGKNYHMCPKPDADIAKYADYQIAQIQELLTNYGPVSTIWFDGGGSFKGANRFELLKGEEMARTIRSLQPSCLINSRIGGGEGDYGNPEQTIPGEIQDNAFEVCMTIHRRWGYNQYDRKYKSGTDLIHKFCDIAHKGGNFLLNVGPDGEGRIIDRFQKPLHEMGRWLAINGEAIYGTKNSLFAQLATETEVRSTTRILDNGDTRIYMLLLEWPIDGRVLLEGLKNTPIRAWVLGREDEDLQFHKDDQGVTVEIPEGSIDPVAWVVALDLEGAPRVVKEVEKAGAAEEIHADG